MSLPESEKETLRAVALMSISYSLNHSPAKYYEHELDLRDYPESLQVKRATFVTLYINNELRGCIGTLEANNPLVIDIAHNARAAAFQDPRFPPVNKDEFEKLSVHISILGEAEPMSFSDEQDLINQLRPGTDGLILTDGYRRGTFLPSVWESLPEPQNFLQHLKIKAGLPANYWSDTIKISRYTTNSF